MSGLGRLPSVDPADCEAFVGAVFRQSTNAWSSLGFVAAGIIVFAASAARRMPRPFMLFGAVAVAEGIGSLLYHGRPGDAAQLVHDAALVGMVGFIAGWHGGRLLAAAARGSVIGLAVGLVAGTATAAVGVTNVAVAFGVVAIVAAEFLARRRGLPAVWRPALLTAVAIAVATWAAGAAGSPLCEPTSAWQWHAVWHVAAAGVAVWWADAASGTVVSPPPQLLRRAVDRGLGLLAFVLGHTFFRSIEVAFAHRIPRDRPVLLVANHPNGFVDPVVIAASLRRMPRFLAKAALWKVVPARPLLALTGALPVHRRADGDRPEDNADVFAACHDALAAGHTVAIFPEGTTGDRATLDRIRAGAARIAMSAPATLTDLTIIPVGLAFESRTATRPRAVLVVGEPVVHDDLDGSHPDAVAELRERIAAALAAVSPEFESVEQREVLRAAATVVAADDHRYRPPPFAEIETIARRIAAAPPPARGAVDRTFRDYATQLQLVGLSEGQLHGRLDRRSLLVAAVLTVIFGSVVVTATLLHLPAVLVILAATAAVRSTATKGTVRLLVGLGAGVVTWTVFGLLTADGTAALWAGLVLAVEGQIALAVLPTFMSLLGRCWGWARTRDRGDLVRPVLASRSELADAARAAEAAAS